MVRSIVSGVGPLFLALTLLLLATIPITRTQAHATTTPTHDRRHQHHTPTLRRITINWSNLTSAQLANISVLDVQAASATEIGSIPPPACTGWQQAQIAVITSACAGFTSGCIGNMNASAVTGMNEDCANALTPVGVKGLTAGQLAALSAQAYAAFTPALITALQPSSCSGIPSSGVAALGTSGQKFPSTVSACSGLTADCVAQMAGGAFAQLTQPCTLFITPAAWSSVTAVQFANMSASPFQVLNGFQIAGMQAASCAGVRADQVALVLDYGPLAPILAPRMCTTFSTSCLAAMPPSTWSGFARDCIADINATIFGLITPDQLAAINLNGTTGLTRIDVSWFNLSVCNGLTTDQISVLGTYLPPFDTCAGFRNSCLALIEPDKFSGFQPTCFSFLPSASFASLSADQISWIPEASIQGLTAQQLLSLPSAACAGFSGAQVALFGTISPYDVCSGFTASCLEHLSPQAFGSLTSSCFGAIPSEFISDLSLDQLRSISYSILSGVTAPQVVQWTERYGSALIGGIWNLPSLTETIGKATLLGFKQALANGEIQANYSITDDSVRALSMVTSLQLAYCTPECMDLLLSLGEAGAQVNLLYLPLKTFRGLRADQLALVPPSIFSQFSSLLFSELLSDSVNAITPGQIVGVDPVAFLSIELGQLNVELGTVAALSQAQISSVPQEQWLSSWSCAQYNNMTFSQRDWMGDAAQTFQQQCSGGANPSPSNGPCQSRSSGFSLTVFLASVLGSAAGTLALSAVVYFCWLRPAKQPEPQPTYEPESTTEYSASGSTSSTGRRRIRPGQAVGIKDVSLRTPLNPNSQTIAPGSSPVLKHAPSYSQAELQDHLDDEDDIIGSRF